MYVDVSHVNYSDSDSFLSQITSTWDAREFDTPHKRSSLYDIVQMGLFDIFSFKLHNVTHDQLKPHAPFSRLAEQSVYILLKFCRMLIIFDFTITHSHQQTDLFQIQQKSRTFTAEPQATLVLNQVTRCCRKHSKSSVQKDQNLNI